MDVVLNIGNFRIKGAFFDGSRLKDFFSIPLEIETLKRILSGYQIDEILISSVNTPIEKKVVSLLETLHLKFSLLDYSTLKVKLEVDEPQQLGHDRIANVYGALFHFPQNDCIVVDLGTAVTFDYIGCNGSYLGGAIYPGVDIGAQALADYTDRLPLVEVEKPPYPIAKTTKTHIQSGLYWGLIRSGRENYFQMRQSSSSPSDVKIIGTGGLLSKTGGESFTQDLTDIVDIIDPVLTLIGLHEIMKEKKHV